VVNESIVFVKGKVDKKRETPSLLVNEVIPIADAVGPVDDGAAAEAERRPSARGVAGDRGDSAAAQGEFAAYMQTPGPMGKFVTLKLPSELSVKPTQNVADDLDRELGSGTAQFHGLGTRRQKNWRSSSCSRMR